MVVLGKMSMVAKKHAWKADFNQCTGRQLIGALRRAEERYSTSSDKLPFVLNGHSKLFNRVNEKVSALFWNMLPPTISDLSLEPLVLLKIR